MSSTALTTRKASSRDLAVFDKPAPPALIASLEMGNRLRSRGQLSTLGRPDGLDARAMVPQAVQRRNDTLISFAQADKAATSLYSELTFARLDRALAVEMVVTLYRAKGITAKNDPEGKLLAALDMFASDDIGRASGMWEPMRVTPAAVSFACRKLIFAGGVFVPQASELRAACIEARNRIQWAHDAAAAFRDAVAEADAILLLNSYDEWQRPYMTQQYQPLLARMLALHWNNDACQGEDEPTPFLLLVEQEQGKL
jgi:hypothetical protein